MYKWGKNKGFTLLELIISLAIIGLILLGFFRVINSTHRISTKNDRDIKALNILQSEIENLRSQIKQSPGEDGERELFVEDDVTGRKIKVEFNEDTDEALIPEYSKVDKSTNSIYKINDLRIQRELITGNNQSVNKVFNDYKYTISISIKLDDRYFSNKETKIEDVIVLSMASLNEDVTKPESEIPPLNKDITYSIKIKTQEIDNDGWTFENKGEHIRLSENKSIISDQHMSFQHNGETIYFNLSSDRIKMIYMEKSPKLQLYIGRGKVNSSDYTYDEKYDSYFNFGDTGYNKISIYISHTGIKLKDVKVNGKYIGDISKDIEIDVDNIGNLVDIEFNGAEKINPGNHIEYLPSTIKSEVFIKFSN